jgi:starch phosphorylase
LKSDKWLTNLSLLSGLLQHVDNKDFLQRWQAVKRRNKERLAKLVEERCGVRLDPRAVFDVQVKRIHEYKRQFMNILGYGHYVSIVV